jgi:hypothetical protein
MSDEFNKATLSIAKLHQDMEALSRLASPSYLGVIDQMEPILLQHLEISRGIEMAGAAARMQEILSANQQWQELIEQTTKVSRIVDSFTLHQSWLSSLNFVQHDFSHLSQIQACAKLALCEIPLQLTAAERLMAGMDFEAIRRHFQIEMPVIAGLENLMSQVTSSYGSLAESLQDISDITRLPAFVLPGATREVYTTSFALDTLRPRYERDEDEVKTEIQLVAKAELETSGCIPLLQQVDPGLAQPYIGARDALNSNNIDRVRHIFSSLRELWNHLLRRLAPDELVSVWIQGLHSQNDLLHESKPTRRARILYLCRELNNDPLTDFLIHDTKALVKLIELFNRVHELETELTDEQLRAILLKTDSWLMYILQIAVGNFRK